MLSDGAGIITYNNFGLGLSDPSSCGATVQALLVYLGSHDVFFAGKSTKIS